VLGVDFDPEVAQGMRGKGLAVSYGDGTDANFLEGLPLAGAAWVVSTLPDLASNLDLLQALRERHCGAEVAIVAREEKDGLALKRAGAPTVIYPMRNAVDYTVEALTAIIQPRRNRA
jgi:Trk K+ transport system NAD-binding subunit